MVSVDVEHHVCTYTYLLTGLGIFGWSARSRHSLFFPFSSPPPLSSPSPIPNKPSRLCGYKAPCLLTYLFTGGRPRPPRSFRIKAQSRVEPLPLSPSLPSPPPPSIPVPNKPYGFCGRRTPCLYLYLLTYWPRYFRVERPVQTLPLFPFPPPLSPPCPPPHPIPVPNKPSRFCGYKAPCLLTYLLTGGRPRPPWSFRIKARSSHSLFLPPLPPPPTLSPSLISLTVSVDVKHHVYTCTYLLTALGLPGSERGRATPSFSLPPPPPPLVPVPNKPPRFCGRKAPCLLT